MGVEIKYRETYRVTAVRTCPFHKSIGQEPVCVSVRTKQFLKVGVRLFASFAIHLNCFLLHQHVVLPEIEIELLTDPGKALSSTSLVLVKPCSHSVCAGVEVRPK